MAIERCKDCRTIKGPYVCYACVDKAVVAERERCLRVIEHVRKRISPDGCTLGDDAALEIKSLIRNPNWEGQ